MRLTALGLLACTAAAVAGTSALAGQSLPARDLVPPLDVAIGPATRLLVIAPHPDDETWARPG